MPTWTSLFSSRSTFRSLPFFRDHSCVELIFLFQQYETLIRRDLIISLSNHSSSVLSLSFHPNTWGSNKLPPPKWIFTVVAFVSIFISFVFFTSFLIPCSSHPFIFGIADLTLFAFMKIVRFKTRSCQRKQRKRQLCGIIFQNE